uniref:Uncharacterized protein n=1 Tax=Arundo donax TaxID=35708 RepID=A0A0A9FJ41_ARUDO
MISIRTPHLIGNKPLNFVSHKNHKEQT